MSASGTPARSHAARAVGDSARPVRTSRSTGLFRNDSLRVPKWYSSAPNRSGRTDTWTARPHGVSRSNGLAASVDTAHTVDRDLLDEQLLDDLGRVRDGLGGRPVGGRDLVLRHPPSLVQISSHSVEYHPYDNVPL